MDASDSRGAAGPVMEPEAAPLSQTPLFRGLREFYASSGVDAWAKTVPLHITSNPGLANNYANVIVRFIQDAAATGRVDVGQPFYVVELGAGSGKFGYHLVRRVRELRQALGLEHLKVVHLMSDVAESNIDHWRRHPRLRPFVARRELVFARFDVECDRAFHLVEPEGELATCTNPLVVIANYVFDSLPQDLFRVAGGRVEEMLATLVDGASADTSRLTWSPRPITLPRYSDPLLDALLVEAAGEPNTDTVMFPVAALRGLGRLADMSGNRLCLLAADLGKGQGLEAAPEVQLKSRPGFFFVPVDLSIIGRYLARLGPGIHLFRPFTLLDTSLSVLGFERHELRETRHGFAATSESFGPPSRAALSTLLGQGGPSLLPEEWLAVSSMARYDSMILDGSVEIVPRWVEAGLLTPRIRGEVVDALRLFGAEIFWIPGAADSYFNLGTILHELGELKAALAAYVLSIETVGPSTAAYINVGLCLRGLGRPREALEALRDALALDATHVVARGWLGRIELELAGELPLNQAPAEGPGAGPVGRP